MDQGYLKQTIPLPWAEVQGGAAMIRTLRWFFQSGDRTASEAVLVHRVGALCQEHLQRLARQSILPRARDISTLTRMPLATERV
jgi:hypothetical protein